MNICAQTAVVINDILDWMLSVPIQCLLQCHVGAPLQEGIPGRSIGCVHSSISLPWIYEALGSVCKAKSLLAYEYFRGSGMSLVLYGN